MASNIANIAMTEPIHVNEKASIQGSDDVSSSSSGEIVFEDYLHFAAVQRLEEDGGIEAPEKMNWFHSLSTEKGPNVNVDVRDLKEYPMTPDEEERSNASRALRLSSWASVFYLITTDILGPFNAPFAIASVGWVPGEYLKIAFFLGRRSVKILCRGCPLFRQ